MKENTKMRSTIATPEELDDVLLKLQDNGNIIYNVLPCPKSADYSQHDHAKTQIGAMTFEMSFVILYFEVK